MKVYICSPLRGSIEPYTSGRIVRNRRKAAGYCKAVLDEGNTPIAPHLFYSNLLNDLNPKERERGLKICEELIPFCDEVRVFGEDISEGMKHDIATAERLNIPVIYV